MASNNLSRSLLNLPANTHPGRRDRRAASAGFPVLTIGVNESSNARVFSIGGNTCEFIDTKDYDCGHLRLGFCRLD
jgi:hypothetical protein